MKKGFTIAETLGTVIIICVIALIAFPPILNLIKGTEDELDESNKNLVITAATNYIGENNNDFPKTKDSIYYITIEELVKENLLTNSFVESTKLKLDSCVKIKVNSEYKYEYDVEIKCSK